MKSSEIFNLVYYPVNGIIDKNYKNEIMEKKIEEKNIVKLLLDIRNNTNFTFDNVKYKAIKGTDSDTYAVSYCKHCDLKNICDSVYKKYNNNLCYPNIKYFQRITPIEKFDIESVFNKKLEVILENNDFSNLAKAFEIKKIVNERDMNFAIVGKNFIKNNNK